MHRTLLAFVLFFAGHKLHAQTSTAQLWNEYMANFAVKSKGNIEGAATYSTVLSSPKWRALDLQITPEYAVNKRLDIMAAFLYSNTFQDASLSTVELRGTIGARVHLTPDKRIQARLLARLEQRNLRQKGTDSWDQSVRSRLRAETVVPINAKSMSKPSNLWYALLDAEAFIKHDKDLKERFANRARFRAAAGYKLSPAFRFELMYTLQSSRNGIEEDISSIENIIRFRVKHYIAKKTHAVKEGPGN